MHHGDFYHGEKSMTLDKARDVKMELITKSGKTIVLKPKVSLQDREVIDSMFMSKKALLEFYEQQIEDAFKTGVMFSLHVKATMMKVSHPIVFGHCVKIFYRDAFAKHGELFDALGVNVNNGMVDLYNKIACLPESKQDEIRRDLHACHEHRPELAMVDSAKGITNFHSPSDIIVDASMPAMIRNGGKMWGADGRLKDTKEVMPESTSLPKTPDQAAAQKLESRPHMRFRLRAQHGSPGTEFLDAETERCKIDSPLMPRPRGKLQIVYPSEPEPKSQRCPGARVRDSALLACFTPRISVYGFPTTQANEVVAPIHPEAMSCDPDHR